MEPQNSLAAAMLRIRAIALDVDGVLTDGGVWWGPDGAEWKRFSFIDIMGLSLARRAGLSLALISGEDSPLVDRYALKLSIGFVAKGSRDKASALRRFAETCGIKLGEIAFMGDDVNDLPAMQIAGLGAAPATAAPDVLAQAQFIAKNAGGNGAVRELVEAVLHARELSAAGVYAQS